MTMMPQVAVSWLRSRTVILGDSIIAAEQVKPPLRKCLTVETLLESIHYIAGIESFLASGQ